MNLQNRLDAADELAAACAELLASGQLDAHSTLASKLIEYFKICGSDAGADGDLLSNHEDLEPRYYFVGSAWFADEPLLLAEALLPDFVSGFRFHTRGRQIESGWLENNARDNWLLNSASIDQSSRVVSSCVDNEEQIVFSDERRRTDADRSRRRNAYIAEIKAELSKGQFRGLDQAFQVIAKSREALSLAGFTELQAYVNRLPGRLVCAAGDRMLAGEDMAKALLDAASELVARVEAQPARLRILRKNRP